jgi:hypothetical protein
MNWIDTKKQLPEEKQIVLFKIVVLHTKKIRYGRYIDESFQELEAGGKIYDSSCVWGWIPFDDSGEFISHPFLPPS